VGLGEEPEESGSTREERIEKFEALSINKKVSETSS
jgi:hypothetical protein